MIASDGGPQFTSQDFKLFVENWGITHVISSPIHQRANGRAESVVKSTKTLLVKTYKEGRDPHEAMLEQSNTPRQDTGRSPAEMMFNRRTRSFLPRIGNSPKDTLLKEKREAHRRSDKRAHDQKSRKLSKIDVGQSDVVYTYPDICENANFFYEYGLRPRVSSVFPGRIWKFFKTLSRVEIFHPKRIRIRVDGRIRKFANTPTSFSWIQSSRRAL